LNFTFSGYKKPEKEFSSSKGSQKNILYLLNKGEGIRFCFLACSVSNGMCYMITTLFHRINLMDMCTVHIINYHKEPYLTSADISALFWDSDVLRSMVWKILFIY
jgi:hypothetical protein